MTPTSRHSSPNYFTMTNMQKCSFCDNFPVDSLDVSLHQDHINIMRPSRARMGGAFVAISYNERKRLDVIERKEKVNRQRIAQLEWENKRLQQKLKDTTMNSEQLVNLVTHMQMQQEQKDTRMSQLEMIIDILNMKIRFYEGKLDKLTKKFVTMMKD